MPRLEKTVPIEAEGRDQGKTFLITEMPASDGERWVTRAWLAIAQAGVTVPPGLEEAGWAGLAYYSLQALRFATIDQVSPLLNDLMACVKIVEGPTVTRPLMEQDIEEIATRMFLKREAFDLHRVPFEKGVRQLFASAAPKSPGS